MITRRSLIAALTTGVAATAFRTPALSAVPATDVTFLVINDIHACRMGDVLSPGCAEQGKTDKNLLRHIKALNGITSHRWPTDIDGKPTSLRSAGEPIARPFGVVTCGDLTDDGGGQTAELEEGSQLNQFAQRYSQGDTRDKVNYPVYLGLGNHDLDQDGRRPNTDWYRDELRDYVRINHKPSAFFKAPLPADNYHEASDSYSWNWQGLHLIQLQRFGGDTRKGAASALSWLASDLSDFAADGRPVVLFQHYGWDSFSVERWDPDRKTFDDTGAGAPHWWSDHERAALLDTLSGYNVAALFHGHEHDAPMIYQADGLDLIKATAAYKGGFGIVRITGDFMDVALAEAVDDEGGVSFLAAHSKALPSLFTRSSRP
jgi:Cytolysin, a secreted calcineurin-like phosphatase